MLTIPNLDHLTTSDPVLYDALHQIVTSFNQLVKQTGVDPTPGSKAPAGQSLPTPAPPASIAVTAGAGTFNVKIAASPGATPGVQYFLEIADNTGFTSSPGSDIVYPIGNALVFALGLGNVTRYFRVRAKYPSADYSPYTYLGTAANPTSVAGG